MDEKIFMRFQNDGKPMRVGSFSPEEGIVFDSPKDASPLNIAFGLQALLPGRLDPVRLRHDWRDKEFGLDVMAKDAGLLFSGYKGDQEGLPFGVYDLTVEVESYRFKNGEQRVVIGQGKQVEIVLDAEPDTRQVKLLNNYDKATAKLVNNSAMDGQDLEQWLSSKTPREVRKACLLNILTKLAAPPMKDIAKKSLTDRISSVHFADVDRIYAMADPALTSDLDGFVKKDGWVAEGKPKASIHEKMVRDALKRFKTELKGKAFEDFTLASYRQGGRNCLQIVIATPKFPHPMVYTDIDIDLGNPLWDLEGLFVHLGELLDSGRTDHFALHEKLNKGDTKDFVFYQIA